MNYTDAGYNDFLSRDTGGPTILDPLESQQFSNSIPGENIGSPIGGQYVGSGVNASVVTTGQMALDRLNSGKLVLGGSNNKNGTVEIRNDADGVIITMDKLGLFVGGRKIT